MGLHICAGKENFNQEFKNQLSFNEIQTDRSDLRTNDGKDYKLEYASNIQEINFKKIKINFEKSLKNQAEFISDKSFEEILEKSNQLLKKMEFPNEIENSKEENSFIAPPIKFINGEIYKGSWNIKNKRNGFGININPEGLIYKGLWFNGNLGKYGLFLDKNNNYYKGEIKDGHFNGKGEMKINNKYKYLGDFKNDLPNGKGCIEDYQKAFKYNGNFVDGLKNGKGFLEYADGTIYEGDFKNDLFEGEGILKFKDGKKYEGEFKNGIIKGKGKFIWENGEIYEGDYDNFMKNGKGKYSWNGDKYYDGQWINNKQHGKGLIHYNGKEIEGIFRFGTIIKGK